MDAFNFPYSLRFRKFITLFMCFVICSIDKNHFFVNKKAKKVNANKKRKGGIFMEKNQDMNVLDEVNKGATMGMDAIDFLVPKVGDKKFKEVLDIEYNKYKDISRRANNLYENYTTEKEPHETSTMNKMMTWYGIQMRTMKDDTTSKLAELLMQGTNMGIIEGRRLINQNQNAAEDVKNVLNDFVVMQEDSVETLKKYL